MKKSAVMELPCYYNLIEESNEESQLKNQIKHIWLKTNVLYE